MNDNSLMCRFSFQENHIFYRDNSLRTGNKMRLVRRLGASVQQKDCTGNIPSFSTLNIEICIHELGKSHQEEKEEKVA